MTGHPEDTPLVRIAQVDDAIWKAFQARVETENAEGFRAYVRFISDVEYVGADPETLRKAFAEESPLLILAADALTFEHPALPVLCIDPEGREKSFRVAVEHLWIVENNLSIGNLLYEELVEDQVVEGWLRPDGA